MLSEDLLRSGEEDEAVPTRYRNDGGVVLALVRRRWGQLILILLAVLVPTAYMCTSDAGFEFLQVREPEQAALAKPRGATGVEAARYQNGTRFQVDAVPTKYAEDTALTEGVGVPHGPFSINFVLAFMLAVALIWQRPRSSSGFGSAMIPLLQPASQSPGSSCSGSGPSPPVQAHGNDVAVAPIPIQAAAQPLPIQGEQAVDGFSYVRKSGLIDFSRQNDVSWIKTDFLKHLSDNNQTLKRNQTIKAEHQDECVGPDRVSYNDLFGDFEVVEGGNFHIKLRDGAWAEGKALRVDSAVAESIFYIYATDTQVTCNYHGFHGDQRWLHIEPTARNSRYPLVVSHMWTSRNHPDPVGNTLREVVTWLDGTSNVLQAGRQFKDVVTSVFWDYASLNQKDEVGNDRTPDELEAFLKALKNMDVLYSHDATVVLMVGIMPPANAENPRPYFLRGWCVFERRCSGTKSQSFLVYSLGMESVTRGSLAPRLPQDFDHELETVLFTTERVDKDYVSTLYRQLFKNKVKLLQVRRITRLHDTEAEHMARVIPHWTDMKQLVFIECHTTLPMTSDGVLAMLTAIEIHLPNLTEIWWVTEDGTPAEMTPVGCRLRSIASQRGNVVFKQEDGPW